MQAKKNSPAIFLDRDGVLIKDLGYVHRVEDVQIYPDVEEGLRALKESSYLIFIVTNQSGVARGYFNLDEVDHCHGEINRQLGDPHLIDHYYICPHHPEGKIAPYSIACNCRKPGTGMLDEALKSYPIDLEKSFIVGDKISDIQCGLAKGIPGIQIDHGQYPVHEKASKVVRSFYEAVEFILQLAKHPSCR